VIQEHRVIQELKETLVHRVILVVRV